MSIASWPSLNVVHDGLLECVLRQHSRHYTTRGVEEGGFCYNWFIDSQWDKLLTAWDDYSLAWYIHTDKTGSVSYWEVSHLLPTFTCICFWGLNCEDFVRNLIPNTWTGYLRHLKSKKVVAEAIKAIRSREENERFKDTDSGKGEDLDCFTESRFKMWYGSWSLGFLLGRLCFNKLLETAATRHREFCSHFSNSLSELYNISTFIDTLTAPLEKNGKNQSWKIIFFKYFWSFTITDVVKMLLQGFSVRLNTIAIDPGWLEGVQGCQRS